MEKNRTKMLENFFKVNEKKKRKKKPRSTRQLHVQSQHQKILRRYNYLE